MFQMFYGTTWDPRLIVSQILTMQCLFYVSLGLFMWVLDAITGNVLSLGMKFEPISGQG